MTDLPSKYFFRQRFQNRLYEAVVRALDEAAEEDGIRKKDIAETLDVHPSQVSRWLSGPANWEADTVSDLLYAAGAEADIHVTRLADKAASKSNRINPIGESRFEPRPVSQTVQQGATSTTGSFQAYIDDTGSPDIKPTGVAMSRRVG